MIKTYDRRKAVQYARNWALGTNPDYGRMVNDCTNFVSQVLHEGGWPMVGSPWAVNRKKPDHWWHGAWLTDASYTWGGAHNFYEFLKLSGRGRRVSRPRALSRGDVVQLWNADRTHVYHSMVVTDKVAGELRLSYHTTDTLDKPISEILETHPRQLWIFWKISDLIPDEDSSLAGNSYLGKTGGVPSL